jgi:peptidoglycan/LPS O-acetylase OafA/YrhL
MDGTMRTERQKFAAIESLRGWMAWWVVFDHAMFFTGGGQWLIGHPLSRALGGGELAVQVFMIVSGFVITHLLVVKQEPYGAYITRRWFRLVPLFLAMLILAIITRSLYEIAFIQNPWTSGGQGRIDRLAAEGQSWPIYILLHLSLLHGFIPDSLLKYSSSAFLAPAWSLSLEWQFYLIAPFLVAGLTKIRKSWYPIVAIVVSVFAVNGALGTWEYPSFLLLALPFFLIGITSRLLFNGRTPWLAIVMTGLSIAAYASGFGLRSTVIKLIIVGFIWALFLLITAREGGTISFRSRIFDGLSWAIALNPVVVSLGRVSYSTYLGHIPILTIVIGGGMILTGSHDRFVIAALTAVGILLTGIVSFAAYRYIEQPGVEYGTRWARRRPVDDEAAA